MHLQGPGIQLSYASNINVTGNAILQPMAAVADNQAQYSQPIDTSSAIYLDIIAGEAQVSGNLVLDVNQQNVPQVRRPSPTGRSPTASMPSMSGCGGMLEDYMLCQEMGLG